MLWTRGDIGFEPGPTKLKARLMLRAQQLGAPFGSHLAGSADSDTYGELH